MKTGKMSVTQSSVSYCAQQMIVESEEMLPNFFNFLKIYSLYRILWFSVIHQQESAIGTPMFPPSQTSLPISTVYIVTVPLFEFP